MAAVLKGRVPARSLLHPRPSHGLIAEVPIGCPRLSGGLGAGRVAHPTPDSGKLAGGGLA